MLTLLTLFTLFTLLVLILFKLHVCLYIYWLVRIWANYGIDGWWTDVTTKAPAALRIDIFLYVNFTSCWTSISCHGRNIRVEDPRPTLQHFFLLMEGRKMFIIIIIFSFCWSKAPSRGQDRRSIRENQVWEILDGCKMILPFQEIWWESHSKTSPSLPQAFLASLMCFGGLKVIIYGKCSTWPRNVIFSEYFWPIWKC